MTDVRKTSLRSSRAPAVLNRWLAVTAAAISLVVPGAALGWSPDMPGGIRGPANHESATQTGLAERTATELGQRAEVPPAAGAGEAGTADGFSWTDAGIGAGAVAGLAGLAGAAYLVRRRIHASPRPAV